MKEVTSQNGNEWLQQSTKLKRIKGSRREHIAPWIHKNQWKLVKIDKMTLIKRQSAAQPIRILVNICQHDARGKHACMLPIHDAFTSHPGPKHSLHK